MKAGTEGVAEERYLTAAEVAERLKVSEWAVREWLKSAKLTGFQPGGRRVGWRIRESDLMRFVERSIAAERGDAASPMRDAAAQQ